MLHCQNVMKWIHFESIAFARKSFLGKIPWSSQLLGLMWEPPHFADAVLSFSYSTFHKTSLGDYFSISENKAGYRTQKAFIALSVKTAWQCFFVWLSYNTSFFNIDLFNKKTWFLRSSQLSFLAISILQWKRSQPHSSVLHFLWKYFTRYAVLYSEWSDVV